MAASHDERVSNLKDHAAFANTRLAGYQNALFLFLSECVEDFINLIAWENLTADRLSPKTAKVALVSILDGSQDEVVLPPVPSAVARYLHPNSPWTHYRTLLRVDKPEARAFYEIEALKNNWSARELEHRMNGLRYEHLSAPHTSQTLQTSNSSW